MASKGARSIELPIYVVNIGLLYTLLLTSGLVLAWVTIYRHEQSIAELRQMLNTRDVEDKRQSQAVDTAVNHEPEVLVQENNSEEMDDNSPRVRRGREKDNKKDSVRQCHEKCVGEKGEKGAKGRKGKRGKRGEQGKPGPLGPPGPPGGHGFPGTRGERGDRGSPGYEGPRGVKGEKGDKGVMGKDGNDGRIGEKGDKGKHGSPGLPGHKGSKGDEGKAGATLMYFESAHIVGTGGTIASAPTLGDRDLIKSWKRDHTSGNMTYDDNGHLIVNVAGVYYVYSQMFYFDRNNTYTGFNVYIDDKRVLKAIYSIVDFHKPYHTQFISGVFRITKGQKIWIGTTIKRKYCFNESSSFFGAFMLHP